MVALFNIEVSFQLIFERKFYNYCCSNTHGTLEPVAFMVGYRTVVGFFKIKVGHPYKKNYIFLISIIAHT